MKPPKIEIIVTQEVPGSRTTVVAKAEVDAQELAAGGNGMGNAVIQKLLAVVGDRVRQHESGDQPPPPPIEICG